MGGEADELITVNVLLADRRYPLRIKRSEEASLLNAAKLVNDKIHEFQGLYEGKDKQDYLAMCVLNLAVEYVNNESRSIIQDSSFTDKLQTLSKILTDGLS